MSATSAPPGLVDANCVYTLDEVKSRLKLGVHALRRARRAGLKVKYVGRNGYILGRDLIAFH